MSQSQQTNSSFLRSILHKELARCRLQNPSFSLRAFSKRLGVSHSALSEVLNGKRPITVKFAHKVARHISLEGEEFREFGQRFDHGGTATHETTESILRNELLSDAQYKLISRWWHFAIVSLAETRGFKSDPVWIASRLGIPVKTVEQALVTLVQLGILKKKPSGRLSTTGVQYRTSDQIPNLAIRAGHAATLELAREALSGRDLSERDFSAQTLAIDPAKIDQAKLVIREFHAKISNLLEVGHRTEVYKLSIQFFPLTKSTIKKKEK